LTRPPKRSGERKEIEKKRAGPKKESRSIYLEEKGEREGFLKEKSLITFRSQKAGGIPPSFTQEEKTLKVGLLYIFLWRGGGKRRKHFAAF